MADDRFAALPEELRPTADLVFYEMIEGREWHETEQSLVEWIIEQQEKLPKARQHYQQLNSAIEALRYTQDHVSEVKLHYNIKDLIFKVRDLFRKD
jgi:hypothetical protein